MGGRCSQRAQQAAEMTDIIAEEQKERVEAAGELKQVNGGKEGDAKRRAKDEGKEGSRGSDEVDEGGGGLTCEGESGDAGMLHVPNVISLRGCRKS